MISIMIEIMLICDFYVGTHISGSLYSITVYKWARITNEYNSREYTQILILNLHEILE